jgi:hypothetical protein
MQVRHKKEGPSQHLHVKGPSRVVEVPQAPTWLVYVYSAVQWHGDIFISSRSGLFRHVPGIRGSEGMTESQGLTISLWNLSSLHSTYRGRPRDKATGRVSGRIGESEGTDGKG